MTKLLGSALVTVAQVRIALWVLPWRALAKSITVSRNVRSLPPSLPLSPQRLEWAVTVASRVVPHATCLTQALALQQLLARHGYRSIVQVGVSKVDERFTAHAWVEHDGQSLLVTSQDVARYSRFFSWPASRLEQP
jgi:hypothetical protein